LRSRKRKILDYRMKFLLLKRDRWQMSKDRQSLKSLLLIQSVTMKKMI
jgi:hypothetical protein